MAFLTPITPSANRNYLQGGPFKVVQTITGALYVFEVGPRRTGGSAYYMNYHKSTDYGRTWSSVEVDSATAHLWCSVWYDRWSGITGDLIHMTFTDITSDDVWYQSLDTSTDTLGTQRLVFNGATAAITTGSTGSITVARGGNIYIYFDIDAGTEVGFYRSTDGGVNWSSRAALAEVTPDHAILMPGYATDSQDIMAFFWDTSANEISRKIYDDSANTWTETLISGSMADSLSPQAYSWSAISDVTNSKNYLAAWNNIDLLNSDLQVWSVDETTITALTDIVTNGTDDQALVCISLYGSILIAFYAGKTDGTDVITASARIYTKQSSDGGSTWTSEELFMPDMDYRGLFCPMYTYSAPFCVGFVNTGLATTHSILVASVSELNPGVNGQIGMN